MRQNDPFGMCTRKWVFAGISRHLARGATLSELFEQPSIASDADGRTTIFDVELGENRQHMPVHGALADEEAIRDLSRRQASGGEAQNIDFAPG